LAADFHRTVAKSHNFTFNPNPSSVLMLGHAMILLGVYIFLAGSRQQQ